MSSATPPPADQAHVSGTGRKLSLVIARLNVGGPAVHVALIAGHLRSAGYQVELVTGRVGPSEGDMEYYARERGIEPVIYDELGRELHPLKDIALFLRFYRMFRRTRPDVVHTHTAKAGALARPAAWLAGVPVIVHTFHGHVFRHYFGRLKTWVFLTIERVLAKLTSQIIVLGEEQKREIAGFGVTHPDRIAVVPLGLDLEALARATPGSGRLRERLGIEASVRLIGIVARLVPVKCHEDFFLAAARVKAERDDVGFVVVGDGELRARAEEQVRALGLEKHVHFMGWQQDMVPIYPDLDVVALTSRNEGLPTVIIEAMAAGVPCVSTRVGSVPDLIAHGEDGVIVEPGDIDGLAAGMLRLLDDPEEAREMGRRGKEKAVARYGTERMIEDLDRLYDTLLARKGMR